MATYNLTDNVNDSFEFQLRGNRYVMRYPRTEELEDIEKMKKELDAAEADGDKVKVNELNEQVEDKLYDFISPDGHEMAIRDALGKENIRVLKNFNTMIRTELSIN